MRFFRRRPRLVAPLLHDGMSCARADEEYELLRGERDVLQAERDELQLSYTEKSRERLDRLVPTPVPHDDEPAEVHALSCKTWTSDDPEDLCDCGGAG